MKYEATILSDTKAGGKCYPKGSKFSWDSENPHEVKILKELCWANRIAPTDSVEAVQALSEVKKEAGALDQTAKQKK